MPSVRGALVKLTKIHSITRCWVRRGSLVEGEPFTAVKQGIRTTGSLGPAEAHRVRWKEKGKQRVKFRRTGHRYDDSLPESPELGQRVLHQRDNWAGSQ